MPFSLLESRGASGAGPAKLPLRLDEGILAAPMERRTVLRTMVLGFALMVTLVIGAAYFGYQQSNSIQELSRTLVREHLVDTDRGQALEARIQAESRQLLDELGWLLGACLVLAIGGAGVTVWVTNRSFRRLEHQTEELNKVSWHLVDSHEKISRRFSHEMHDELGQALTGLKSMLKRTTTPHREEMVSVLNEVMRDMRELSQILRPVILDDFGLDAGLRWLCERYSQRTGIDVEYASNYNGRLAGPTETHLFRVAQEALTNIARHSKATQASMALEVQAETITLTIEDNGTGIQEEMVAERPSLGMVGMRARIRQLRGTLDLENKESEGLRILARVPRTAAPA